jgi:hypothetical protein
MWGRAKHCEVSDCNRPAVAFGLCSTHRQRERNGEPVRSQPLMPERTPWTFEGREDELAAQTAAEGEKQ